METMRINKFLSAAGVCSRRAADVIVEEKRVTIDGETATPGSRVSEESIVKFDGKLVTINNEFHLYAIYKPVGYITSLSDEQGEGIGRFIPEGLRLYPVGRLDKDSEGLLLLTDDGDLMNKVLTASQAHEKEYIVKTDKRIDKFFIERIQNGVEILNKAKGCKVLTAPCQAELMDEYTFRIILIQGLNRQIRRMCASLNRKVISLKRVRIVNIELGNMEPGQVCRISGDRLKAFREAVNG